LGAPGSSWLCASEKTKLKKIKGSLGIKVTHKEEGGV